MVEIALCLAIIGFALVAIIGVLPAGMNVQRDNREQDIINLDAAYLMDAIRSGPRGQDNLVNFVNNITVVTQLYDQNGQPSGSPVTKPFNRAALSSGSNIIGVLSMPKYITNYIPGSGWGFYSNSVVASMRAINGPAVDQGASQTSRDFAFQYQVSVEVVPAAAFAYQAANGVGDLTWKNVTAPSVATNLINTSSLDAEIARQLQTNLCEIRLAFRWPELPPYNHSKFGGGRQVFRSSAAGALTNTVARIQNQFVPLYFIQPLAFQQDTNNDAP